MCPADNENLLHGEFDAEGNVCYDIANKEKYEYFKLNVKDGQNIGFYWGAPDGAPFKMTRTDRAYLVLPREEARQVKGLVLDEAMVETRINSPAEHALPSDKVYDLSGRICQGALAPGIYIRGGRKVLGGGKKNNGLDKQLTRMNKQYASPSIAVIEVESNTMLLYTSNLSEFDLLLY